MYNNNSRQFTFNGNVFSLLLGLVLNITGGILYSLVKYREGLLDRRKKDYLQTKYIDQYSYGDMNQNNTKKGHQQSLGSIESPFSDNNCDKPRQGATAISTIVNEKVENIYGD